ncbi:hypothetical protein F2Q69_00013008 [Brassica cretica]|uniref:Uncharacterized protein n=1 Tax=Brassica cretica TaxID=69181 RepID=A0A8S9R271_BRACR|nr:hypothetical protein F2Q69_00013008 [Brassica cretica]
MPNSTRSNKDKHLLFSEDPAHLECAIRKDQRSTSLDATAFTSTDSRTQSSTDTRPSSSTSIDTTPRTSIDHQSRNMVAIVILRHDENGDMYDLDGHLRNATEDPAHLERTIRKDQRSTSLDAAAFTSTDSHTQPSTDTRPSSSTDLHRSTSIDTTPRTSIDHQSRNMVAIVILRQDENGNLYDQDGHLRNATDDDFWQVVKHEKLGEGDFEVESSMSFGRSHWSLKEISSELTIRGRYEEEAIVRCTSSAVDRYRREASTIEDYDRSMYILYHRSMSRREMRDLVHAQQYQKQQGQTPAILRRSCSLGTNDPQRPTFHIARRSSFHVDRFSHPTVDRHPNFIVDRSTSFDIERYYTAYIDRSSVAKHCCDCYSQTGREWKPV